MSSKKIIFLGHGVGVKFCIDHLLKSGQYSVSGIVTHPYEEHKPDLEMVDKRKEIYGDYAYNVFNVTKDYNIELSEAQDVNASETVDWIKMKKPDFIISLGCRNIIKQPFLEIFRNRVINLHTTPLPNYRGGASDSWMILNGLSGTEQYGCSHFIDTGIDSGNIIAKEFYKIPEKAYPIDVFKARMDILGPLLLKSLKCLEDSHYTGIPQTSDEMTVFPRLFTPRDGKIDFVNFSGSEIERFVRAFGYPFSGAHCFYEEQRICLLKVTFHEDRKFHSFCNGLIFGRDNNDCYKIAVNGGYIKIHILEVDGEVKKQRKILKLGKFLK